jgi:hypothetical protein
MERDGGYKRQLPSVSSFACTHIIRPIHIHRRSHMQAGVKAKSWESRMRKTATEAAVKKLHKEMVEEKAAEAAR